MPDADLSRERGNSAGAGKLAPFPDTGFIPDHTQRHFDAIDAAFFSGDAFRDARALMRFEWYIARWKRQAQINRLDLSLPAFTERLTRVRLAGRHVRDAFEFDGFIVPGTLDTMAIDERYRATLNNPAGWAVTHIPTLMRVQLSPHTDAISREDAIGIAQRFYTCASAVGADLASNDGAAIARAIKACDIDAFWGKVVGT